MKTCSFRGAQPRLSGEGLLCTMMPECDYFMERCNKCAYFNSYTENTNCQQQCPIQFNLQRKHRFVNGYESILNCPTSCNK